jgi:hypothetical protein
MTTYTYQKPFGTVTVNIAKGEDEVKLTYRINDEQVFNARELSDKNKALIFWVQKDMDGKKVSGIRLDNYEEVKAVFDTLTAEIKSEMQTAKSDELEAFKNGTKLIEAQYHDGEYLSGYMIFGQAAALLQEIHAAKYIDGWGMKINGDLVNALGETFTLQQAIDYMQPANDEKAAKIAEKKAALDAKFIEAKNTGKKVLIRTWMSDCHSDDEDCSFDTNSEYAMPDGSTKTTWSHCW